MRLSYLSLILLFTLITIPRGKAQIIDLRVTDYGWIDNVPLVKPLFDAYLQEQEFGLNLDQPILSPKRLMEGTANSTAASSRGMGSEYGTAMRKYMLGVSAGVAVDTEEDVALKDEISGIGGGASVVLGYNFKERWNVFGHFGGLSHRRSLPGIEDTKLEAELDTTNIGTHVSYDLVQGSGNGWFGWGGIRTTVGYEYNDNEFSFVDVLNEELEFDTGVGVIQGRLKGKPRYTVKSKIHSFPLEVSSNVHFFRIFTLFAGTGVDFNFGSAKGSGDVKANVTSPLACTSGLCTNLNLPEIEATGNLNAKKNVDPMFFRGFAGLQLNIWRMSIFGQVNKIFGNKVLGASVGVRANF